MLLYSFIRLLSSPTMLHSEVAMWMKATQALGDMKNGPVTPRSEQDWENLRKLEAAKLGKKNAATLWSDLADQLGWDGEPGSRPTLPENIPREVAGAFYDSKGKDEFIKGTVSFKKELAVKSLACFWYLDERRAEEKALETWEQDVEKLIAYANAEEDAAADELGLLTLDAEKGDTILNDPTVAPNKQHWEVQRAAAYASWCILGSYIQDSTDMPTSVTGAEYYDTGLDYVQIIKNKPSIKVDSVEAIQDNITASLRLCFAGRLVPVPRGQPPSFLKCKLRIA